MTRIEEVLDHTRAHNAQTKEAKLERGRLNVLLFQSLSHSLNIKWWSVLVRKKKRSMSYQCFAMILNFESLNLRRCCKAVIKYALPVFELWQVGLIFWKPNHFYEERYDWSEQMCHSSCRWYCCCEPFSG